MEEKEGLVSSVKRTPLFSNRKVTMGASAALMCVLLTAVCSFFPYVIDPSRIGTAEFWSDEIIITVISVYMLIDFMGMAKAYNAGQERSEIAKARVKFQESLEVVVKTGTSAFFQWVKKVLEPMDQDYVNKRELRKAGISDERILSLDLMEIKKLYTDGAQNFDLRDKDGNVVKPHQYFRSITKEQYKAIRKIKTGAYSIPFVSPSYYLSAKSAGISSTYSEIATHEQGKKSAMLTRTIFVRVLGQVMLAVVLGSFVYDTASGNSDMATALYKLVSRLFTGAMSGVIGWNLGCNINDLEAKYIEKRTEVHMLYESDLKEGKFKPKDENEMGKAEFAEKVRKANAETMKENGVPLIESGKGVIEL